MKIQFVDLNRQYLSIKKEIDDAISGVVSKSSFILGEDVPKFEESFARFCGSKFCLGVDSGTSALFLALKACGIKSGDEVITAPNSYISTSFAISQCGAKPVFVDIDKDTHNLQASLIKKSVTKRTKAILPVHLYGHPADMAPIVELAQAKNLRVIEDCCQAHGARYKDRHVGTFGDIGCFSFYPSKNLGAFGDAGAVITDDNKLFEKVSLLKNYGQKVKYVHLCKGYNNRLDTLQAAILQAKLRHLPDWIECRRNNAKAYTNLLKDKTIATPVEKSYAKHSYHIYCVKVKKRDEVLKLLAQEGIMCNIHYPIPIHLQKAYSELGLAKGSFPLAEKDADEILSLPMFPELLPGEIKFVADSLKKVVM